MGAKLHLVNSAENVLPLTRRRTADTVAALAELLNRARAGEIQGFMFVAKYRHGHEPGATGDYRSDPVNALGAAAKLWAALNEAA